MSKSSGYSLSEEDAPKKLQTDAGKEFYDKQFRSLLESYEMTNFSTSTETKGSIGEHFKKTLKTRMWRLSNNCQFALLHTWCMLITTTTIWLWPAQVEKENERTVFNNLYKSKPEPSSIFLKI